MSDTAPLARAGQETPPPSELAVKLSRELAELRAEAAVIHGRRHVRRLRESAALDTDWVTPWAAMLQQRADDPTWMPIGSPSNRRHGTNFPFYQNEQQLTMLRDLSRVVVGTNTNAAGILRGYTSFVIGTGFKTKVSAKGDADGNSDAKKRVTAFLDVWARRNMWAEKQIELCRRTERDGDGALRTFADDGYLKVRFVWPEQITQPPGESFEEWSFGIKWAELSGRVDCETVAEVYVADLDDPQGESDYVPGDEVVLFQPEHDTGVKRRIPLFAYGMREVLDTAGRLTRNLGEGAAVRESIAYMRKQMAADGSDVEAANFADADFRERKVTRDTAYPVSVAWPGMVVDFGEGTEPVPPPANAGTAADSAVVDLLIRSACARINAPEWLGSSNAANMGAYTSSLVAESPFVIGVKQVQAYYRERLLKVVRKALDTAVAFGLLSRADVDACEVDLIPPSPEARDKDKEASRAQTEITLGVDSRQRYMESQDRDAERIERENAEWDKRNQQQQGGPGGPPMPGGPSPGAGEGDPFAGMLESDLLETAGEVNGRAVAGRLSLSWGRVLLEDGYSGTLTDKLGRVTHWSNGVRVKAAQAVKGVGEAVQSGKEAVATFKTVAGKIGQALDSKLSDDKVAGGVYKAVKVTLKGAKALVLGAQLATQAVAFKVAEERLGQGPKLDVFKKAVKIGDLVGGYIPYGATIAALGPALGLTVGKVTGFLPTASVAYLVFAAVRDPKQVGRAAGEVGKDAVKAGLTKAVGAVRKARDIVSRWVTNKTEGLHGQPDPADAPSADRQFAADLADWLDSADNPEWAGAVYAACLDRHPTDRQAALDAATEILAEHPDEPDGVDPADGTLVEHGGDLWTAETVRDLLEGRDLSKLHAKFVVDKNGHRRKVWVRGAEPAGGGQARTGADDANRQREKATDVAGRLLTGGLKSAKQAKQLAEALKTMTRKDIESLKKAHDLRTGGSFKKEQIAKLVAYAHSRRKVPNGLTLLPPPPDPSPAPGEGGAGVARVVADAPEPNAAAKAILGGLREANHLSPEQKQSYATMVIAATAKMPPKALEHLAADLKGVIWSKTLDDIAVDVATFIAKGDEKKKKELLKRANTAAGAYHPSSGTAFLDGDHKLAAGGGAGTYAHELSHAIDRGYRYSGTPAWKAAFEAEIRVKGDPLSAYAKTSTQEGFAEFGRAVYFSSASRLEQLAAAFPKAAAFFKENDLWPASSETSSPAAKA
jgi:hypothetical protein